MTAARNRSALLSLVMVFVRMWYSSSFAIIKPSAAFLIPRCSSPRHRDRGALLLFSTQSVSNADQQKQQQKQKYQTPESPWHDPDLAERQKKRKRNNNSRFRQHVNPLSRKYQQQTLLTDAWPRDVFRDCDRSLHLDIGCSKGGFLLDLAGAAATESERDANATQKQQPTDDFNYLGLEIRPMVAQFAKERIPSHGLEGCLEFLGCNVNVDLERIVQRYQQAGSGALTRVTIQFPDPHFKTQHAKRRVVTTQLVDDLARFMPADSIVFLQSDIQSVLDDMRDRFGESRFFADQMGPGEYMDENILGVPTEREVSVLAKGLPVFRSVFQRTSQEHHS